MIDIGVIIVPSDRTQTFLTDRTPSLRDAIRYVEDVARSWCLSGHGFDTAAVFSAGPGKWPLRLWLRAQQRLKRAAQGPRSHNAAILRRGIWPRYALSATQN